MRSRGVQRLTSALTKQARRLVGALRARRLCAGRPPCLAWETLCHAPTGLRTQNEYPSWKPGFKTRPLLTQEVPEKQKSQGACAK